MTSAVDPDIFEPEGYFPDAAPAEPEEESVRWRISSIGEADWAMRKLLQAKAKRQELVDLVSAEVERLQQWADELHPGFERDIEYFGSILEHWHQTQVTADPLDADAWKHEPNKTIKLPGGGKLTAKRTDRTIDIDVEAFIAGCGRPELIQETRTYKPIHAKIKQAVLEDGEVLPGVEVVPPKVTWKAVSA